MHEFLGALFIGVKEWAGPIRDVVLTFVAIIVLNTWRRQLAGTAEYELARRLLREIYQFREALQSVRFPFISVSETQVSQEGGPVPETENKKEKRHRGLRNAYLNRYTKVNEARNALEATLLEVRVLWGDDLITRVQRLYDLDAKLYAAILEHLDDIISDAPDGGRLAVDKKRTQDLLMAKQDRTKDEFFKSLQAAITDIEEKVRPRLKRRII